MRYYVLLLTVSFFTRFPSLFIRVIDADEAVYANTARGILRGLLPYRDLIDQKPPFIYYFYAFFLGIINDLRFLHAITIIIVWLTAIVVYRLVTRCFDKHSGVVAGILYAAFVSTVGYSSNTEIFMNLPLVLGVWFFHLGGVTNQVSDSCEVRSLGAPSRCSRVVQPRDTFEESLAELVPPRRSLFTVLAAGICVGLAGLFKQQAVIVMVPLALMIIVSRFKPVIASVARRSRFKDEKRDCFGAKAPRNDKSLLFGVCELFSLIVGAALPFAVVLLYFSKLGIMHDFLEWAYIYNMRYIAPESSIMPVLIKAALVAILPTLILWWYSLKRIGELRGENGANRGALVFGLLWLAASIYAVTLGQRFYTHYFVQLIPPLVFLAAQPIAEAVSNLRGMPVFKRVVFLSFLIIPTVAITITIGVKGLTGSFDSQKPSVVWAGEFLNSQTKPDDRIFVWGDALVEYFADRSSSSRFMNGAFVIENRDPCFKAEGVDVSTYVGTREFGMLMSDLRENPPKVIVDMSSSDIHCWQNYPIEKFAPLAELIRDRYKNIGEYKGMRIYGLQ